MQDNLTHDSQQSLQEQNSQLRAELHKSEVRLRHLADSLPQVIWENDAQGRLRYVNQRWLDYSGLTAEQSGDLRQVLETLHPADVRAVRKARAHSLATSTPLNVEARIRRRDGEYNHFLVRTEPLLENGKLVNWFGTATDITEVKLAAKRIRELADNLRVRVEEHETLLRALPVGVFIAQDADCREIIMNPAGAAMLRLSPGSNASKSGPAGSQLPFRVLRNGVEVNNEDLPMQQTARTGEPVRAEELDIEFADGSLVTLFEHASPLFDEDGRVRGCVGVFVDITERKMADRALLESEQRFQTVARATNDAIWDWDLTTGKVWWNQGVQALFGYSPEEASDSNWWEARLHPDDRQRVLESIRGAAASQNSTWRAEYRFCRRDGSHAYIFDRGHVVRDSRGNPVRMIGVMQDLTDRKRAEDTLADAGRRKDEFLAILAHELRNPLAALSAAAHLLARSDNNPETAAMAREGLKRQVSYMARLLDDLLDVARITRGLVQLRIERVNVAEVVQAAVDMMRSQIEARRHRLMLRLPEGKICVDADRIRLCQIIANLLSNAAKYTDPGGNIEVRVRTQSMQVQISVSDSGIGIPAEMCTRIFEMFSQARPALQGSEGGLGIGLSLVRGLVDLHGGSVEVHSEGPGRGSEFTITLPSNPAQTSPMDAASPTLAASTAIDSVRILVADDNTDSAMSWAALLELSGHEVRTAHDGYQALSLAAEFRPQLALLDIGMPGLNGYEVAQRIRASDWGQAPLLVALTGWGQERDKHQAYAAGFDHHFTKPVDLSVIEQLLASLAK